MLSRGKAGTNRGKSFCGRVAGSARRSLQCALSLPSPRAGTGALRLPKMVRIEGKAFADASPAPPAVPCSAPPPRLRRGRALGLFGPPKCPQPRGSGRLRPGFPPAAGAGQRGDPASRGRPSTTCVKQKIFNLRATGKFFRLRETNKMRLRRQARSSGRTRPRCGTPRPPSASRPSPASSRVRPPGPANISEYTAPQVQGCAAPARRGAETNQNICIFRRNRIYIYQNIQLRPRTGARSPVSPLVGAVRRRRAPLPGQNPDSDCSPVTDSDCAR